MVDRPFRYSRAAVLWLQVFFYSVGGLLLFLWLMPECVPAIGSRSFFFYFAPAASMRYWYYSAYFPVALFVPFLNRSLMSLSRRQYRSLLFTILFVFSLLLSAWMTDAFYVNKGQSSLWLFCLYCFGGYVKRFGAPVWFKKPLVALSVYISSCALIWISKLIYPGFSLLLGLSDSKAAALYDGFLYTYISPLVVLEAFALLCLFTNLQIRSPRWQRLIKSGSSLSFGVYLAHMHPLFKQNIFADWILHFTGSFTDQPDRSAPVAVLLLLAVCCGVYLAGTLIDWVRHTLFRLLRIEAGASAAEQWLGKRLEKWLEKA